MHNSVGICPLHIMLLLQTVGYSHLDSKPPNAFIESSKHTNIGNISSLEALQLEFRETYKNQAFKSMKKPTVDGNQKSGENQLDRLVVYPMIYKLLLHPRWFEIAGFLIAINIVMPFTWINPWTMWTVSYSLETSVVSTIFFGNFDPDKLGK